MNGRVNASHRSVAITTAMQPELKPKNRQTTRKAQNCFVNFS